MIINLVMCNLFLIMVLRTNDFVTLLGLMKMSPVVKYFGFLNKFIQKKHMCIL